MPEGDRFPEVQLDESVVVHNVAMLKRPMFGLLLTESWGGNGGHVVVDGRPYACSGANGYADSNSGKIEAFGNVQNIPMDVRENNVHFILHVSGRAFNILASYYDPGFSESAKAHIETAIERHNQECETNAPLSFPPTREQLELLRYQDLPKDGYFTVDDIDR